MDKEDWLSLNESFQQKPLKTCTRIAVVPTSTRFTYTNLMGQKVYDFLKALSHEKKHIMNFYSEKAPQDQRIKITDEDYNRLAFLAAGIFGAESSGAKSIWYYTEYLTAQVGWVERLALCATKLNWERCMNPGLTSRGPTQIKKVPFVGELYGITRDDLEEPYLSGVATMGFLIETYKWYLGILKNKDRFYNVGPEGRQREKMTEKDLNVFLTYMYRGDTREIYNGTATPKKSCYYKRVQKFQKHIKIYVQPKEDCSQAGSSILD